MTQFQFELICKIIETSTPGLAPELCGALNNLVVSYNAAVKETDELKAQLVTVDDLTEIVS